MATLTWEQTAFATGPADDVEAGVRRAYRDAGLAGPERVVVLGSPAAGAAAAAWLTGDDDLRRAVEDGLRAAGLGGPAETAAGLAALFDGVEPGRSVRDDVRTAPWERARRAAYAELGPAGWAAQWAETGGRLWPQVDRLVTAIRRAVADLGGEELRRLTLDAVLGQHDAPWLSAFDGSDGLAGLRQVAGGAGWWWPYERVAIVTERPVELHRDDAGRLHRGDGPAMAFSDGFALHAWHGMPVPADFGAAMTALTPSRIREEENAELRRVMLEHFGFDRYLAESGAEAQQSDETGVLWRIELPGDEPLVMVEVVNSTPEPDGTSRTYFLRVPPWVRRAREGVAWTFGMTEGDYHPQRET
ncbi:hypothetical protein Misp01_03240 [Microtetraspora sp. NBRC 13810]|uniref:DUF6745 domain-containing protein n=1 Tax=Microtetraspora sp. NBRC 13810 TaxID=3030990 RepID=UPI0024A263D2|nr:hypothetical protein [Microtetraspora sp. NBRC 13810]GLW05194.1 hypothetical protein Misp01_03240 [Microtetraspora sp. NBRC 13810]